MNDAKAMESALRNCNFDVTRRLNVNLQEMFEAIRAFGNKIKRADVGLFFYAGHALQVKGENYLIPIGADVKKEHEVRFQCLEASLVTSNMEAASNPLNIIILDACRNNPFRSFRSTSSGLAEMRAPVGTIIQYSTAAGSVAKDYDDQSGKNGLYTSKLLKYIQSPGLEINMMFRKVREDVHYASQEKQTPWESNSLMGGQFYFKPLLADGSHTIVKPQTFKDCGDRCPVETVSWNDVQEFINQLNKKDRGRNYRLPTEAEWEYAARAGTNSPFAFGNCLSTNDANYDGNYPLTGCSKGKYRKKALPVGSLRKNAWGLYDMHGNVWEWCQDWKGNYSNRDIIDPTGPTAGSDRVIRGGGWYDGASGCRSAIRDGVGPEGRSDCLGFRLCAPGR